MNDYTIDLLKELISIDSVNPSLVPGATGEQRIATFVESEMRKIGLEVHRMEAAPGRPNVIGVLHGKNRGRTLMLCGHLDTVGVMGMKAPFDPVENDGRIYGRGSQDMKGGVAAMICAARSLVESGGLENGSVILTAVADEEYASIGAEALVKSWRADGCIVLEPTDLQIATAHKGFSWIEVITHGRAAHGSRPKDGIDAILHMGRVLSRLESLSQKLLSSSPHALLGTPSLHGSLITGGRELSTYPDRCELKLERRTISGEAEDAALVEVQTILRELKHEDDRFGAEARFLFGQPPYEMPDGFELPQLIENALLKSDRRTKRSGMTFWTDAAIIGKAGIPSVIFGPGGAGLHGIEEYVRIDEVLACRDALVLVAREFCQERSG